MSVRPSAPFAFAFAVLLAACNPSPALPPVTKVELVGGTATDNAILALTPEQVTERMKSALKKPGGFSFAKARGEEPSKPAKSKPQAFSPGVELELDLEFTRESRKAGEQGSIAEVGAELNLRRAIPQGGHARYKLAAMGQEPVSGEGEDARKEAMQKALGRALDSLAESARLQLLALEKKDEQLLSDLEAKEPRVREFALRALAERENPAAVPALEKNLSSEDDEEVRRAMGGLVGLRSEKSVPALIEATKGRDPSFQREVLFAIGAIGGGEAEAYLFTVAQGHDQEALRVAAKAALEELSRRPPQEKKK